MISNKTTFHLIPNGVSVINCKSPYYLKNDNNNIVWSTTQVLKQLKRENKRPGLWLTFCFFSCADAQMSNCCFLNELHFRQTSNKWQPLNYMHLAVNRNKEFDDVQHLCKRWTLHLNCDIGATAQHEEQYVKVYWKWLDSSLFNNFSKV